MSYKFHIIQVCLLIDPEYCNGCPNKVYSDFADSGWECKYFEGLVELTCIDGIERKVLNEKYSIHEDWVKRPKKCIEEYGPAELRGEEK